MRFRFEMAPDGDAIAFGFSRWANLVDDWRPPFRAIVVMLRTHAERHLQSEGTYTGPRFAPLSPAYRLHKDRVRPGRPILTFDGVLRNALTTPGAPGSLAKVQAKRMEWGISPDYRRPDTGVRLMDYAMAHATGAPQRNLPKRPPMRYSGRLGSIQNGAAVRANTIGSGMRDILGTWIGYTRQVALRAAWDRSPAARRGDQPGPRVARPNLSRTLSRMERIARRDRR